MEYDVKVDLLTFTFLHAHVLRGIHTHTPILTLLSVWDCPTSISMLEASMDRQKFTNMMDLSERMYLRNQRIKSHLQKKYLSYISQNLAINNSCGKTACCNSLNSPAAIKSSNNSGQFFHEKKVCALYCLYVALEINAFKGNKATKSFVQEYNGSAQWINTLVFLVFLHRRLRKAVIKSLVVSEVV